MTTGRLTSIHAKVERARKHLSDLETECHAFLATSPYEIACKRDPQTREVVYYAVKAGRVPPTIAAITADVLQNLRRTLDHLACELVIAAGKYPTRNTGFPIFSSVGIYKAQVAEKVQGMGKDALETIDTIKPYKGGNDVLWRLHNLSNIDKQRPLAIVGLAYRFQHTTPSVLAYLRQVWSRRPGAWPSPESAPHSLIEYERRHSPLNVGDVLFIDLQDAEMNGQMKFGFDLAFGEGKFANGLLLLETLSQMIEMVETTLPKFDPLMS